MKPENAQMFDRWLPDESVMPPRSRLYHLEPIGVGTSEVESLTSYITRLAQAHCVSVRQLLLAEILPRFPNVYWTNGGRESRAAICHQLAQSFNATGTMANDAFNAVQVLTGYSDLHLLTMWTWRNVLSSHGLMRRTRAWCPACFDEWISASLPVYEPLLWTLKPISVCSQHNMRLHTSCPRAGCSRTSPMLPSTGHVGYCSYCQHWLGGKPTEPVADEEFSAQEHPWNVWVEQAVGEMLSYAPAVQTVPQLPQLADSLRVHFARLGLLTQRARKQSLPLVSSGLEGWMRGTSAPRLEFLLRCCQQLNVLPLQVLVSGISIDGHVTRFDGLSIPPKNIWTKPVKFDALHYRSLLEEVLVADSLPPPSMCEVAKRLGKQQTFLRSRFPDLSRRISQRYMLYRHKAATERLYERCREVRIITFELHDQGLYPSSKRVRERMEQPGQWHKKEIQKAWQQAKYELGFSDSIVTENKAGSRSLA